MPLDFTDDKLLLVQVMAWYRQATSHYLSQSMLTQIYVAIWSWWLMSLGHNELIQIVFMIFFLIQIIML